MAGAYTSFDAVGPARRGSSMPGSGAAVLRITGKCTTVVSWRGPESLPKLLPRGVLPGQSRISPMILREVGTVIHPLRNEKLAWTTCALTLLLAAAAPRAEVLGSNAAGFALRVEAVAPVPVAQAWEQLIHPERWWSSAHTWTGDHANMSLEPVAGGCFCERGEGVDVQHMVVSQVRPGKSLVMLGGLGPLQAMGLHGAASFVLSATPEGGTRLVHEYRVSGYSGQGFAELAPVVDAVQQGQVDAWAASLTPAN